MCNSWSPRHNVSKNKKQTNINKSTINNINNYNIKIIKYEKYSFMDIKKIYNLRYMHGASWVSRIWIA